MYVRTCGLDFRVNRREKKMSIYPLYKEIFPSTSVEEVVCANFTSSKDINIIVARSSILQIYKFVERLEISVEDEDNDLGQEIEKEKDETFLLTLKPATNPSFMTGHLELISQYKLHGNITSMGVVRTISSGANEMDSLLLSFKDAKLSLLEFSLATNNIVTVSIHYYEREEFKLEFLANTRPTELRVDPSNRCAVLNFFGDKLAILPFRQEEALNLDEEEVASKWPYLPSFVVELPSIQSRIKNVIDMKFLYDYYEPTLAILFESCPTWPGKMNTSKDTCSLVVVSIDISQKLYPVIYSMDKLPHSSVKLIPIQKPVGGILIITANAIIHVDQSSPGIGIAVNGYATSTTDFPLDNSFEHLGLALEGCHYVFLDKDEILLFLRNGGMYLVKLIKDGRSISRITIEKVGTNTLPSCACYVAPDYFFLGSRLGDSHLIQYKAAKSNFKTDGVVNGFNNMSRRNTFDFDAELYETDTTSANLASVSSKASTKSPTTSEYNFTICDTLINVGPIVDLAYGELAFTEHLHTVHKELELVSCSGSGTASSLCIFHRNINPIISNSFAMTDCLNMWTVSCRDVIFQNMNIDNVDTDSFHKFLFISKKYSTMVLACGEELQELERSDFYTEGPTVAVGSVLNGSRILQICGHGLRLLDQDGNLLHVIPTQDDLDPEKSLIIFASIVDPYVLLLFDTGKIKLLKADDKSKSIEFYPQPLCINDIPTASCYIYRDDTGLFTLVKDDVVGSVNETNISGFDENVKSDSFWCVLYRQDGSLEIHKLPEFKEVFHFPHFDLSPAVLSDVITRQNVKASGQTVEIQEILLINIGRQTKDPYLIARSSVGDIMIYKAFRYIPGTDISDPFLKSQSQSELTDRLAIRFSRIPQEYISRETMYSDIHDKPVTRRSTLQELNIDEIDQTNHDVEKRRTILRQINRQLIPFTNIAGYSGVFVTGAKPLWLICARNNYLRVHPMNTDGEIRSFTPFHNIHRKHGFLYTNTQSELPTDFQYDMEWTVKKVQLNRSVYGIEYHPEMQVYALLTSLPIEFLLRDENGEPIEFERDSSQFLPETQRFTLELISPVTWETVDRHDFHDDEQGLCIKCVSLQTKSTTSGRKSFIAIGTGIFRGEDVGMRGNVYVFEIIEVVPEPDNPQTNHKFKLLCHEEVKGSVTAICDVNGYLLTCVGPKIFIRAFEDNDRLISVAFIDIQIYASSVVSIKDYILLGDVYKGVWFLGFQEEPAKLVLVGKDYHSMEVGCTNFIIDEPVLYFAVADMDRNIHLFQYAPYNVQSFAGQKLIRRGDFHVGAQVKTMLSLPKKELIRREHSIDQGIPVMEEETSGHKQLCLCGTLDGSIGMITPIPEKMYKRMQLLHSQMVNGIQHPAGLNPKSFRLMQSKQRLAINPAKGILDGDLLIQFPNLALHRQREMTKQIGTTVERILDDLLVLQESCDYF
ncbi:CPSF A subunit region-domain-containing protein [Gigaspora rosea]|uniref:CPSF A subunit region-domain-containing protein n=1 Tax=Gigaspora rosea TaxID=44941 RepID=A0A397U2H9_9GLOM|nr:CPSF A subunit region-domain-containing protein [Gigaspora rosea]